MEDNTPSPLPQVNPVVKALSHLIIIMGLYFFFAVLFSAAGGFLAKLFTGITVKQDYKGIIADMNEGGKETAYKISFMIGSLGAFVASALVFARFFARQDIKQYFGFKKFFPPLKLFLLVIVMVLTSLPVISFLSELNRNIVLPPSIEESALSLQKTNEVLDSSLLAAPNVWILLFNLLVIAITPAIGEELLFRGVFMQTFYRLFGQRILPAILLTGFLFSVVHLEVYNILPIMFMGVVFGYMYYWSGNIMVTVWAHFLNNAIAVLSVYLLSFYPDIAALNPDYAYSAIAAIISGVVFAGALYAFYRATRPYHAEA